MAAPPIQTGGPHVLFDNFGLVSGLQISQELPREAPHCIVEVFPTVPGSLANVQVLDAGPFGSLTPCTDSNGNRPNVTRYTKFQCKGVMDRVAVSIDVLEGAWSVWLTFTWQASDRADYFDRNPFMQSLDFVSGGIAPHGQTARGTYTVPPERKAWIDSAVIVVYRDGASTTPGQQRGWLTYYPAQPAGPSTELLVAIMFSGAVGATVTADQAPLGAMMPNDYIEFFTQDLAVGGSCEWHLSCKFSEFDF